jgi:hypothetical protein
VPETWRRTILSAFLVLDSGQVGQSADVDLARDGQELNESRGETLGSLKLSLKMPGEEPLPKQYGL